MGSSKLKGELLHTDSDEDFFFTPPSSPIRDYYAVKGAKVPWYADFANYLVGNEIPAGLTSQAKKKFLHDVKQYYWDEPYLFKQGKDHIFRRCVLEEEVESVIRHCHTLPTGGHAKGFKTAAKVLQCGFYWPNLFRDVQTYVTSCDECQRAGNITWRNETPLTGILEVELFDVWGIDFMGPFPMSGPYKYILLVVDYVSK